jgi:hypothetical protein
MNINTIKALFIGWMINPVLLLVVSLFNSYASVYLVHLYSQPIFLSVYFIFSNYIIHASFAFLSAYVAAKIAKNHVYYYATIIAVTSIALQLFIRWQVQQRTQFHTPPPFDYYFSLFATLGFALGGAYVAKLHVTNTN